MDAYAYIAQSNPREAVELCRSYNYKVNGRNASDVALALKQLVAREGEPALLDMAEIHPDRELLRMRGKQTPDHAEPLRVHNYETRRGDQPYEHYRNAIGDVTAHAAQNLFLHNNTVLMVAAMLVVAIIVTNKK